MKDHLYWISLYFVHYINFLQAYCNVSTFIHLLLFVNSFDWEQEEEEEEDDKYKK